MGRPKTYERNELIDAASELFRDQGFAGTSAAELEAALGVNRSSIYAEFGSKQALFDASLQRYREVVVDRRFGALEEPGAGVDGIKAIFEFYGQAADGPASGRGCLLCNTAVELGPLDPSGTAAVHRYLERIGHAFKAALDDAARSGDLRRSVDTAQEAQFLTASILGIFVMLRAAAPPATVSAAATAAIDHTDSLRSSAFRDASDP